MFNDVALYPLFLDSERIEVHLLAALSALRTSGVKPIRKDLIVLPDGASVRRWSSLDPDGVGSAMLRMYSQVAQEVQYILLVSCAQHIELSDHPVRLRAAAGVLLDRG